MAEYSFLNLSPAEFENLSRDILQKHMNLYLESFTSGKDSGIDFRHSSDKNKNFIVQCKRYSSFASLKNSLKKEVTKLKPLKPKRYILTTSVGLNPAQKDEIKKMFSPFIESTSDIFGNDDLNNLLNQYEAIETKHFKLWLSSVNIIQRILESKIYNQTSFEEEKIKETVQLYVENDSYYDALDIIKDRKYAIISGIPGIGKTTLARILVYHFLANGFEEFIFISDSIDDGYKLYKEHKKQIFLFDDFLGRNFLDRNLSNNEEQKIVRLIEKINKSENKILILTTREYILAQAKLKYDIFNQPALEFAKCVIDLSQYTKLVRAKILYNHLFFSKIEEKYLKNILETGTYLQIINHRNYNPRIIETITQEDVWSNIKVENFSKKIIEFLDYPESVWKHVYENQISRFSQCTLANLMSAGTPILYEDLQKLMQNFAKNFGDKYDIKYNDFEFKKTIKELENTFILTKKDSINNIAIEYQNPSIQDFLVNYLKENKDFLNDIIYASIYFNQLFQIFSFQIVNNTRGERVNKNKIILDDVQKNLIIDKVRNELDYLNSSTLTHYNHYSLFTSRWVRKNYSDYSKLNILTNLIPPGNFSIVEKFIIEKFQSSLIPIELESEDFSDYINLLEEYQDNLKFNKQEIIDVFFSRINYLEEINDFERFEFLFKEEFEKFVQDDKFYLSVSEIMNRESENADEYYLENVLSDISSVGNKYDIVYLDIKNDIEERMKKFEAEKSESEFEWKNEKKEIDSSNVDDDYYIHNMFDGLISI